MTMKKKLAASGLWSIFAAIFNNLSTMLVFVALARLLSPTEFGVVAFATVFIDLSRIVVLGGIPDALIQRKEWDDEVASTAFWANLGLGVFISIALALLATPLTEEAYGSTFGWVLAVLSLTLVIEGASAVHVAKLRREFRHKVIAKRSIAINIVSGFGGIAFAYFGLGVWALVLSRLIAVGGSSAMLWLATDFRPGLTFSIPHFRSFSRFAGHILGSQLLNQIGAQVPALLIGLILGPIAIAQYRVGWRSFNLVISLVILPVQTVAVSGLSRLSHDRVALGSSYLRLTRVCALISCPTFLGMAATAQDFVPIMFGPQWTDASYIVVVLALAAGPMTIAYFEGAAISASGRSDLTLTASLYAAIGNVLASALAVSFGPAAVAMALTIRQHITLPFTLNIVYKAIGVPPQRAISGIISPFLASVIMAVFITFLRLGPLASIAPFQRLLICVPIGGFAYFMILLVFFRPFLRKSVEEVSPLLPVRIRSFLNILK